MLASRSVSAMTEAPVSIMKVSRRPSMRPSTWKCPLPLGGMTTERVSSALGSTDAAAGAPVWARAAPRHLDGVSRNDDACGKHERGDCDE